METIINALKNRTDKSADNFVLPTFSPNRKSEKALIIGGGISILEHTKAIKKIIEQSPEMAIIFAGVRHLNILIDSNINNQYAVLSGKESSKIKVPAEIIENTTFIYPPYPRLMGTTISNDIKSKAYEINAIDFTNISNDSPLVISIQLAMDLGAVEFFFVGFDGYSETMNQTSHRLAIENKEVFNTLKAINTVDFYFLTNSLYSDDKVKSIYSYIE